MKFKPVNLSLRSVVFWTCYALTLYFLIRTVMGKSLDFFFWKDDWYLKWAGKYDPNNFYEHFPYWQLRAPEFWLRQVILDSRTWQHIGLLFKVVNSLLFALFIKYFLKKDDLAISSGVLYALFAGGQEAYTWAIINAILVSLLLVGFIVFDLYLNTAKRKYLYLSGILFVFLNVLYFGRALGLFPLLFFSVMMYLIGKNRKRIPLFVMSMVVGVPALIVLMAILTSVISDVRFSLPDLFFYLKEYKLFFGSVGELIRIPFSQIYEVGGLTVHDRLSGILGFSFVVVNALFVALYVRKQSRWLFLVNIAMFWVTIFYFFNWMWGGGGVYTMVGGSHRYLTLSAIGYLFFIILIFSRLSDRYRNLAFIILSILSTKYTLYLINIENNVRNRAKVEPIYQQIVNAIPNDVVTPFILIDTPNELKSFVSGGWFPYVFGYYRGINNLEKLPTVFAYKPDAVKWLCETDDLKRKEIAQRAGSPDYSGKYYKESEIFAWYLEEDGKLSDMKGTLVSQVKECIN